jgi:ethanolamine utilization microcompartment shell protein EutS
VGRYTGWFKDQVNNRLELYYNSTLVAHATATTFVPAVAVTSPSTLASTTSIAAGTTVTAGTSMAATTTVTAGTGLTVTTGNSTVTAGDLRVTAGNERLGVVETFAMTEPTSALVMKTGTAPAGAITTSGGIFSSTTVVRKIIAAGTVSNVET